MTGNAEPNEIETTTDAVESTADDAAVELAPHEQAVESVLGDLIDSDDEYDDDDYVEGEDSEPTDAEAKDGSGDEQEIDVDIEPSEHRDWDAARAALIENGFEEAELESMDDALVLSMGQRRMSASESAETGEPDEAAAEGEQEVQEQGEAESLGFDSEKITKAVAEKLGSDFDESESKAISGAIVDVVQEVMKNAGGGDLSSIQAELKASREDKAAIEALVAPLLIGPAVDKAAELYPQINEEGQREKLMAAAKALDSAGYKAVDMNDLISTAAAKLFGASGAKRVKKHDDKIKRSKEAGSLPTPRVRKNESPEDITDRVLDEIVG